ncbi:MULTISPECIES: restriction endonuclease subunit S [unclassified Pseudoalteromonas]|uniref:restriction endonuclease subunit S n=1 Tax=unclassified Pseudoalteromonas TaxID=194690 RepID=UPI001601218C|nr:MULTISPECIES: restriction endonuclease subunit S [unclassified Pseudoalteromonas]MBB1351573.1 restriction endonuclease subunit S [Pseudoalteromonas sp. SG45-3]MBB1357648.1 restriction endonuclease subunit S [Pseudoalteromonas sp. SG45-6]
MAESKTPSINAEQLITEHLDIWTTAIEQKSSSGRGSSKKFSLHGIKKLRELILELAVRGKLVPQDPNDESASVLLERIAAEKAQLVKDKKIKKQSLVKEMEGVPETDIDLPEGWCLAYIPQIIAHEDYAIKRGPFGSSLKKAYFVESGYKVYEQQHAINDDFFRGEYYIDSDKFEELKAFEVKPNDLIISCSGTVGKVAIAPPNMERGIINQALLKIALNNNALTNEYFKILFPAFYMMTDTLSDLKGTAQKNMVSVDTLKKEPFPYPPLKEQHRIVAKVDELMDLCDALEAQTENSITAHQTLVEVLLEALLKAPEQTATPEQIAEQFQQNWQRLSEHFDTLFTTTASIDTLKQTILQLAVMGKLVPQNPNDEPAAKLLERIAAEKNQLIKDKKIKKQKPLPEITDEEKPFELPNGWEWCRLQDSIDVRDGTHDSPKDANGGETYPLVTSKDFKDGSINFKSARQISAEDHIEISKRSHVEVDDILFSMIGGNIGNQVIVKDSREFSIKNVALFKYYDKKITAPYYFKIYTENLASVLQESAKGGAQPFISLGALRKLVFALPPIEEQHRIVAKADELMTLCDQLKASLTDAQKTKLHLTDAIVEQTL